MNAPGIRQREVYGCTGLNRAFALRAQELNATRSVLGALHAAAFFLHEMLTLMTFVAAENPDYLCYVMTNVHTMLLSGYIGQSIENSFRSRAIACSPLQA